MAQFDEDGIGVMTHDLGERDGGPEVGNEGSSAAVRRGRYARSGSTDSIATVSAPEAAGLKWPDVQGFFDRLASRLHSTDRFCLDASS